MPDAFSQAIAFTRDKWEGGAEYTDDPQDPGGATRYGISLRFLRDLPLRESDLDHDLVVTWHDVAALDAERSAAIYQSYFWARLHCGDLPPRIGLAVFDTAVNLGRTRTARILQRILGSEPDGAIGPDTLAHVAALRLAERRQAETLVIRGLLAARRQHYDTLSDNSVWADKYIRGWHLRCDDLERACTAWLVASGPSGWQAVDA